MACRLFVCDARMLSQALMLMPGSVRVVGSVSSPRPGEVAMIVEGPWKEVSPMPELEMRVDDSQAFVRKVTLLEKSAVLRPDTPGILTMRN